MKEEGFTLIELLAVIIILGVVIAIAVPGISSIINKSKDNADILSAQMYLDAVKKSISSKQANGESFQLEYTLEELDTFVEVDKTKPTKALVELDEAGNITSASLCINSKSIDYANGETTIDSDSTCEDVPNEILVYTQKECFAFDSTTGTITDYLCVAGNTAELPAITDVVIPEKIDGVNVTIIGNISFALKKLTSLVIPSSVTTIGRWAFQVNKLTNVTIPEGVTTMGICAFQDNLITTVIIPKTLTSIDTNVFYNNPLENITIQGSCNRFDSSFGTSAFANKPISIKTCG